MPAWAAVAFDAAASGNTADAAATSGSFSITIGAGSNRAVVVGVGCTTNTTGISGNVGGTALAIIDDGAGNSSNGGGTTGTVLLIAVSPPSGSQTVSLSWTSSQKCAFGGISFTGVDQSTPHSGAKSGSPVGAITSAVGDMTTTINATSGTSVTSDKDDRYNDILIGTAYGRLGGDTAPGAASVTHTWSQANIGQSGANIKERAANRGGG